MAPLSKPFQLLEINIISAQDLEPISRKMNTYAKAWVHPNRKLSSCMDTEGNNDPTWNDKFVFRVDESFLRGDTSAVMIEIYTPHWFRDVIVGTVRVLVGNLIPPPALTARGHHIGMRFIALQVRRPSGRPQGILNIGVTLLDGSLRSMPLYNDCLSAVGYRDLMQDPPNLQQKEDQNDDNQASNVKPVLRRTRSERSERLVLDNYSPNSSMVAAPIGKKLAVQDSSILSISEFVDPFLGKNMKGKASSLISGAEPREKPKQKGDKASSVINGAELREKPKQKGKKGKGSSVLSFHRKEIPNRNKVVHEKSVTEVKAILQDSDTNKEKSPIVTTRIPIPKHNGHDYDAPKWPLPLQSKYVSGGHFKGSSILSGSEIGPSPSEVAGIMAERRNPLEDNQSSVLDGWSLNESVEGLKSKLERWRTELPPLYDHHHGNSSAGSYRSSAHTRRHSESGSGLFSCFGNICGYECQCVCGKPPGRKDQGSRYLSSSVGSAGKSFL